jgi:carbonic anhydrase
MGFNGGIVLMGALVVMVLLAFMIPPDYEGSCAPSLYGDNAILWGSIPCKRGVVNKCGDSSGQSPINLMTSDGIQPSSEDNIIVVVNAGSCQSELTVVHEKLQFPESCGPSISVANREYQLIQLHFHVGGSEHTIDDFRFDGELHLVHDGVDAGFAVIGVFLDASQDDANDDLEQILEIYENGGHRRLQNDAWNPYHMVPSLDTYFAYNGSLTTPPCTPGIHWMVVQEALTISPDQLTRLKNVYQSIPNYRPLQARAGRQVVLYSSNS